MHAVGVWCLWVKHWSRKNMADSASVLNPFRSRSSLQLCNITPVLDGAWEQIRVFYLILILSFYFAFLPWSSSVYLSLSSCCWKKEGLIFYAWLVVVYLPLPRQSYWRHSFNILSLTNWNHTWWRGRPSAKAWEVIDTLSDTPLTTISLMSYCQWHF